MYTDEMIEQLRTAGRTEEEIRAILIEDRELDECIHKNAYKEWLDILVKMWEAVDKDVDDKRLAIYADELKSIPLGLLDQAVSRVIRENEYSNIPPIGVLWKAIRKELGNPHDLEAAIEHWRESIPMGIYDFNTGEWR